MDYWAQKSIQTDVITEEFVRSNFYSVKVDVDHDGIPDTQIDYEKTSVDIYYEINEYTKTILAAKRQNLITVIGEYAARSIASLFTGKTEDLVFNKHLIEENLDAQDFSTASPMAKLNAPTLRASYRKFTHNYTTTYIDNFEESKITVIDFTEEGEIEEQRIYSDNFKGGEIENTDNFFSDLSTEHQITNTDTGQQTKVHFDPQIPFSHPSNISWQSNTWGSDQISTKYDELQVINEGNLSSTNLYEREIVISIPNRFSLYNDYGKRSRNSVENEGWVDFEVNGMLVTPEDGLVYYTSNLDSFIDKSAKIKGHYFYVDTDENGYYETVYILGRSHTTTRLDIPKYNVISIGLNYDGLHDFVPYERLDRQTTVETDFDKVAQESTMFGSDWIYNFGNLENVDRLKRDL